MTDQPEDFQLFKTDFRIVTIEVAGQKHRAVRMQHHLSKPGTGEARSTEPFLVRLEALEPFALQLQEALRVARNVQASPPGPLQ